MLAPKYATYNGRSTFANPKYFKKAQSDKPCLYEIPYDTFDPANRFAPDGEEIATLAKESRSKLDKDKVKPYDYSYQNSLYETFKPPSKTYLDQLERAKEVRKTMWRKTTTQNREPQLPRASRNTNPYVSKSTGVNHTTSVSRPQLKCYHVKDKVVPNNSQVNLTKKEIEDYHRISSISKKTKSVTAYNDSSNSRTSNVNAVCTECGKCVFNSNHDACVSKYLNDVNSRTKKPKVVPISASKPKRKTNKSIATPYKKTVPSDTTIQKLKSYYKELYENTNKAWKWWIPTGKLLNSCTGKVDSEPTHGSIVDIPHIHACKQTLGLSASTSFNGQKQQRIDLNADALYNAKQENLRVCSSLVLHQMTSAHNRSELRIHDHSNEPSSTKLVPKVVPLAVEIATSRQELELLFHYQIAMLRTTNTRSQDGIDVKDNDKGSKSRSQDGIDVKDNDKGSMSRSQSMKEQAYNKEQRKRPRPHELNDKSNLIDLIKEWGFVDKFVFDPNKTPDPSHRPPQNCPKCGNPVDGLYCRQCALLLKKLKEVWSTICYEDEIFQDFLNTSESSNDKTNVVIAPQEPFVFNMDPGENSLQSHSHIDHHCCYGCGDSLDGIFCQRCTCESCRKGAHYVYNCPPKVLTISNPEPCHNQNVDELTHTLPSFHLTCYSGDGSSFTYDSTPNFVDDSPNVFNPPSQPPTYSCEFCGNDAHYGYDCPPQVLFIYNSKLCYNQDFNFP
ncbi:hypothetical protein Tco_0800483 [Tanacetum coccineum]|uniref:CCHC-type domain-containing protein n=1 Tax=Tanacetum coccineum TaxID=301880 RepID=A0ABQ4ZU79_9ASTR